MTKTQPFNVAANEAWRFCQSTTKRNWKRLRSCFYRQNQKQANKNSYQVSQRFWSRPEILGDLGKTEKENHLQSRLQNERVNYFGCKSHKRFAWNQITFHSFYKDWNYNDWWGRRHKLCRRESRILGGYSWKIPDVLGYIQSKTELTRSTIEEILCQSGRIVDIIINPQLFLDLATTAIKRTLYDLMIDGIKYQKIGGSEYEMALFEAQELEVYLNDFSFKVSDLQKPFMKNLYHWTQV